MLPLINLYAKVGSQLDILFHLSSNISFAHVEPNAHTALFCLHNSMSVLHVDLKVGYVGHTYTFTHTLACTYKCATS